MPIYVSLCRWMSFSPLQTLTLALPLLIIPQIGQELEAKRISAYFIYLSNILVAKHPPCKALDSCDEG